VAQLFGGTHTASATQILSTSGNDGVAPQDVGAVAFPSLDNIDIFV
jgi:hypothetical protein